MDASKIKAQLKTTLREMIPVVLGILIALWINNWQQSKSNRQFLNHVFQSIQTEHKENIKELEEIIPTHERLVDSIYKYADNENVIIGQYPDMVGGLSIALIGNTSWKSFINNQIQLVDFDIVKKLSFIDVTSGAYEMQTKRLTDFFFENIQSSDSRQKEILAFILVDLTQIEEDLLKAHLELKELLEKSD